MVKIKGYRFECEVCLKTENKSVVSSIQVFYRKDGSVSYSRARHLGADKRFYYHQQNLNYVNTKLRELSNIEHGQDSKNNPIEQTGVNSGLKGRSMVGLPGFEPGSVAPEATSLDQASRKPH
jgi:hypothetical protein